MSNSVIRALHMPAGVQKTVKAELLHIPCSYIQLSFVEQIMETKCIQLKIRFIIDSCASTILLYWLTSLLGMLFKTLELQRPYRTYSKLNWQMAMCANGWASTFSSLQLLHVNSKYSDPWYSVLELTRCLASRGHRSVVR